MRMVAGTIWNDFMGHRDFDTLPRMSGSSLDSATASTLQPLPRTGGRICSIAADLQASSACSTTARSASPISVATVSILLSAMLARTVAWRFFLWTIRGARLKILGHMEIKDIGNDPDLTAKLATSGYKTRIERAVLIHLENFDWNCSQHITPRFTQTELETALAPIRKKLIDLQQENEALKAQLGRCARPTSTK